MYTLHLGKICFLGMEWDKVAVLGLSQLLNSKHKLKHRNNKIKLRITLRSTR